MQENTIQDIATAIAVSTAIDFLEAIPSDASQTLSPQFLQSLGNELRAELQALIQSRLLWFQQAVQLELAEQQQLKKSELARPKRTQPDSLPQQLVPTSRPVTKPHTPTSRKVIDLQKPPLPTTDAGLKKEAYGTIVPAPVYNASQIESQPASPLQYTQLDLLGLSEPEPRRAPEPPREEILKHYALDLEDFGSRDPDATPRRRRRRAAALTS